MKFFLFQFHLTKVKTQSCLMGCQKDILCFMIYYDDLEVVNAIGNSTKKHKLGTFFSLSTVVEQNFGKLGKIT